MGFIPLTKAAISSISLISSMLIAAPGAAGSLEQDRAAIRAQAGCYRVNFQYQETFAQQEGYELAAPYRAGGLEWVQIVSDEEDKIELQHLLLAGPMIIKHWRQNWSLNRPDRFDFQGYNQWLRVLNPENPDQNSWTQQVLQVDDSPRYECSAPWIHQNNQSWWECDTWAPLPRREFSKRNDYQVLNRRNRHQITDYGWVHEQDNAKLVLEGDDVFPIVKEKGENSYKRVEDSRCAKAQQYWQEKSWFWTNIHSLWMELRAERNEITLRSQVDGQRLYAYMFDLEKTATDKRWSVEKIRSEAKTIIERFLIGND